MCLYNDQTKKEEDDVANSTKIYCFRTNKKIEISWKKLLEHCARKENC